MSKLTLRRFDVNHISDQKRLVRGEQLLRARTALRARDHIHNARWRVLITAGGAPAGEVGAIREVMPRAHITAVDRDVSCLEAAIAAGVDDVVQCDLADFSGRIAQLNKGPVVALRELPLFDLVHLDLCANPSPLTRDIVRTSGYLAKGDGVFIVAFSFGRDVVEAIRQEPIPGWHRERLLKSGVPDLILRRICYLLSDSGGRNLLRRIDSICLYRGAQMPMCSVLCSRMADPYTPPSFLKVAPGDLELAVTYPDPALLYDTPQERIETLRHRAAALKAIRTRQQSPRVIDVKTIKPRRLLLQAMDPGDEDA